MPKISRFLKRIIGMRPKVGLVLGGGVARGLAHIGVLKVLYNNNLKIDYIAATSSGALIAALFAGGMLPFQMERVGKKTGWQRLLQFTFSKHAPFNLAGLRRFIVKRIGDKHFSDLKIPLRIMAADLVAGSPVVIKEGKVADAVCASSTFPGMFVPVEIGGRLLVDGGVFDNLPVEEVRKMGAEIVIAVDVVPVQRLAGFPPDMLRITGRAVDLMLHQISRSSRNKADILIVPHIDEDISHLDLHYADRLIKAGEEAGQRALEQIKEFISLEEG